ncbi:MAG: hypothetical protein IT542_02715 [Rubellimicrobium sp.]|nr:hypothetical protein [Rubellimicrobium sp.]
MCWGIEVTGGMVAAGVAGAALTWHRGERAAIPLTLLFFAAMEGLQLAGYTVIDQCGSPVNRTVTGLSMLHIALQPIVINAYMLALARPDMGLAGRRLVLGLAALASVVVAMQMFAWPWTGPACTPGRPLCGVEWCTISGNWHQGWTVPYADIFAGVEQAVGMNFAFPTYALAVFLMPVFYGAWRFALFHLLIGPVTATLLTNNPNEAPAVWCLASVLIALAVLVPPLRRFFMARHLREGAA